MAEDVAPRGFADLYARYIINGRWLGGTGPLWFCEALLIFCLGYALFRTLRPGRKKQQSANPDFVEIPLFLVSRFRNSSAC